MKIYKHAMVIGVFGFVEKFVLVETNGPEINILNYKPLESDRLIFEDIPIALSMTRPQWHNGKWIETKRNKEAEGFRDSITS